MTTNLKVGNRSQCKGFSLLEVIAAMVIMSMILGALAPVYVRSIINKAGEKTALDIITIQEAARAYYIDKSEWPKTLVDLQNGDYLPKSWDGINPFQKSYIISSTTNLFTVTTDVVEGIQKMLVSTLPSSSYLKTTVSSSTTLPGKTSSVSIGIIVAWSGNIASIPTDWALCDGKNGTPDLRDKFIVGASQDQGGVAQTSITGGYTKSGGTINHNHGGNTGDHQLTVAEMPSHQHANGYGEVFTQLAPFGVAWKYGGGQWGSGNTDRDNYQWLTDSVGGDQAHSHTIANANHIPPYYALAFIMKIK